MNTSNLTPTVRALIAINVIVFLVQSINKVYDLQIVSLFGLHYFTSERFLPFQVVTYMFVHGGFSHLFGNMLSLFIFGPILEHVWGQKRFLIFYFVTGVGAGLVYMLLKYYDYSTLEAATQAYVSNPNLIAFKNFIQHFYAQGIPSDVFNTVVPSSGEVTLNESVLIAQESLRSVLNTPTIGASGAIFGIMGAFAMLFPNTELMLLFFPFPIKAKYLVSAYILYEVYAGIQKMPGDNVAHFAHVGGILFAFILIKLWGNKRNVFY